MEFTGSIKGINQNYMTKKFEAVFEINEEKRLAGGYAELKEAGLLDINIKKHRKKRSLNANAYFHVLVGRLADCLCISKVRCKNMMVGRYGQPFILENGAEAVIKTNLPARCLKMKLYTACHVAAGQKAAKNMYITKYSVVQAPMIQKKCPYL